MRLIMYDTQIKKYFEMGTAMDARGKLCNAPIIRISKETQSKLKSLTERIINGNNNISDINCPGSIIDN